MGYGEKGLRPAQGNWRPVAIKCYWVGIGVWFIFLSTFAL